MSELSFSRAIRPHFSIRLLLHHLMHLFSFIISHPLYFLYLVFFSPYIFKLLSFLSPLFITTFLLLLLALLTVSPTLFLFSESSDSKLGSLLEKCWSALDKLRPPVVDDGGPCEDFRCLEELEAYKIVFEADSFEVRGGERQPLEMESEEKHCLPTFEGATSVVKTHENVAEEKRVLMMEEEEEVECGNISEKVKEKKVKAVGAGYDKVDGQKERVTTGGGESEGMEKKIGETTLRVVSANGGDCTPKAATESQRLTASVERGDDSCYYYSSPKKEMESPSHLGSFGSMRKEKEWKRTLACKLFEERHNVNGSEGMDLLWETYEADSCKVVKAKNDGKKKISTKKKEEAGAAEYYSPEEDDEEEEAEEGMDRQLCCLRALKFSAGKMNLGMGRPNLQKISRALKGIGWLHQVSKHGRKAHG